MGKMRQNISTIQENTEILLDARRKVGLEEMHRKLSECSHLIIRLQDKILMYVCVFIELLGFYKVLFPLKL
jgi:hypothetical protein